VSDLISDCPLGLAEYQIPLLDSLASLISARTYGILIDIWDLSYIKSNVIGPWEVRNTSSARLQWGRGGWWIPNFGFKTSCRCIQTLSENKPHTSQVHAMIDYNTQQGTIFESLIYSIRSAHRMIDQSQGRICMQLPMQRAGYTHHMVQVVCENYRTAIRTSQGNKQELF
jgi:hypothetical protein